MIRGKRIVAAAVAAGIGVFLVWLSVSQAWQDVRSLHLGGVKVNFWQVTWVWADNHAWYGILGALLAVMAVGLAASVKDHTLAWRMAGGSLVTVGSILVWILLLQALGYGRLVGTLSSTVQPYYGPVEEFTKRLMECWQLLAAGIAMILVGGCACISPQRKAVKRKPEPIPAFTGIWTMATVHRLGRVYAVVQYDHEKKQSRILRSRLPGGIRPGDRLRLQENGVFTKIG